MLKFTRLLPPTRAGWALIALVFAQEPLRAQSPYLTRAIPTRSGQTLDIDLRTGGPLEIVGTDGDVVRIHARPETNRCPGCLIEAEAVGADVQIRSHYRGGRQEAKSSGMRVEIQVPRKFNVRVQSMGGSVLIENVTGEFSGQTSGGGLVLRGLSGRTDLTTLGGPVVVRDSELDGRVYTLGGDVTLDRVSGALHAATAGGQVKRSGPADPERVSSGRSSPELPPSGEVRIQSQGGDIRVPRAPDGADLHTLGGRIRVRHAESHVKAQTLGGDIDIDAVDGWVRAVTSNGDVRVRMIGDPNRGRRDVEIISMSGDVDLVVPSGLEMELDVQIAVTQGSSGDYRIISDFPLRHRQSSTLDTSYDPPRSTIYGTARRGDGRHKVRIRTVNGNVRLRESQGL